MACSLAMAMALCCFATPKDFDKIPLSQEMDIKSLDASSNGIAKKNDALFFGYDQNPTNQPTQASHFDGIVIQIGEEDGKIWFYFSFQEGMDDPIERVLVNGRTLKSRIQDIIDRKCGIYTPSFYTNLVLDMSFNPLWGKKLAVIGDSLISAPTKATSYPYYIA